MKITTVSEGHYKIETEGMVLHTGDLGLENIKNLFQEETLKQAKEALNQKDVILIAAQGLNREIGQDNKLLWNLPGDMKRFKEMTTGNIVVMGRKTYESIGRPLPNRTNIILSRDKNLKIEGCIVVNTVEDVFKETENIPYCTIYVIGGEQIYEEFIHIADGIELTVVNESFPRC